MWGACAGAVPHCEYPTVVLFEPYQVMLFGGSQESLAAMGRFRHAANHRRNMLWHVNLLTDEWRACDALGDAPSARSGHSAVMFNGQVCCHCYIT